MKLTLAGIQEKKLWQDKGYILPQIDSVALQDKTRKAPHWIHFGAGNIFRGFPAALQQQLIEKGESDRGIIVAEGFDYEIIDRIYAPHDNLSLLVTLNSDGSIDKKIIASITEGLRCDVSFSDDWAKLESYFRMPSLQMVSFTITEKGYALTDSSGVYFPSAVSDFAAGPSAAHLLLSKLTALMLVRYQAGAHPIALVSMDNCSHNGEKLGTAVVDIARHWQDAGHVPAGFVEYLSTSGKVSFPWSMIDKITPRPDDAVRQMLEKDGFEDTATVVTEKKTWIAPFVNAESAQYLVIEDDFPNGRPALEKAGVFFTDRDTVNKVEKMKVCTCLNPLHTALAVFGCLLGHTFIYKEMQDDVLKRLVERIGYEEGLPVVVNPGILNPKEFIKEVLEVRFPNPFMPDTPQRIACDTSQKLSIRFGETIKAYAADPTKNVQDLHLIPLVFAGWLRYLMGLDDDLKAFEPSPDPLLAELRPYVQGIPMGVPTVDEAHLKPLLSNQKIFGVDLYEVGLADRVLAYFVELLQGKGAVRRTLEKYVLN